MKHIINVFLLALSLSSFASNEDKMPATHKWVRDYVGTNETTVTKDWVKNFVSTNNTREYVSPYSCSCVDPDTGETFDLTFNFEQAKNRAIFVTESNVQSMPVGLTFVETGSHEYQNVTNSSCTYIAGGSEQFGYVLEEPYSIIVTNGSEVSRKTLYAKTNANMVVRLLTDVGGVEYKSIQHRSGVHEFFAVTNEITNSFVMCTKLITDKEKIKLLTPINNSVSFFDLLFPSAHAISYVADDPIGHAVYKGIKCSKNPQLVKSTDTEDIYWIWSYGHYEFDDDDCVSIKIEGMKWGSKYYDFNLDTSEFTFEITTSTSMFEAIDLMINKWSKDLRDEVKNKILDSIETHYGKAKRNQLERARTSDGNNALHSAVTAYVKGIESWISKNGNTINEICKKIDDDGKYTRVTEDSVPKEEPEPPVEEPTPPVIPPTGHIHSRPSGSICGEWTCPVCKQKYDPNGLYGTGWKMSHDYNWNGRNICKHCTNKRPDSDEECDQTVFDISWHHGWEDFKSSINDENKLQEKYGLSKSDFIIGYTPSSDGGFEKKEMGHAEVCCGNYIFKSHSLQDIDAYSQLSSAYSEKNKDEYHFHKRKCVNNKYHGENIKCNWGENDSDAWYVEGHTFVPQNKHRIDPSDEKLCQRLDKCDDKCLYEKWKTIGEHAASDNSVYYYSQRPLSDPLRDESHITVTDCTRNECNGVVRGQEGHVFKDYLSERTDDTKHYFNKKCERGECAYTKTNYRSENHTRVMKPVVKYTFFNKSCHLVPYYCSEPECHRDLGSEKFPHCFVQYDWSSTSSHHFRHKYCYGCQENYDYESAGHTGMDKPNEITYSGTNSQIRGMCRIEQCAGKNVREHIKFDACSVCDCVYSIRGGCVYSSKYGGRYVVNAGSVSESGGYTNDLATCGICGKTVELKPGYVCGNTWSEAGIIKGNHYRAFFSFNDVTHAYAPIPESISDEGECDMTVFSNCSKCGRPWAEEERFCVCGCGCGNQGSGNCSCFNGNECQCGCAKVVSDEGGGDITYAGNCKCHSEYSKGYKGHVSYCDPTLTMNGRDNWARSNVENEDPAALYFPCMWTIPVGVVDGNDPVFTIDYQALKDYFINCASLTNVEFYTVTEVGDFGCEGAFSNCYALSKVDFSGLTKVGLRGMAYAFYNCTNLNSVTFTNLTVLTDRSLQYAFCGCNKLAGVDFSKITVAHSNSLYGALYGCSNITSLALSSMKNVPFGFVTNVFGETDFSGVGYPLRSIDFRSAINNNENFIVDAIGTDRIYNITNINISSIPVVQSTEQFGLYPSIDFDNLCITVNSNLWETYLSSWSYFVPVSVDPSKVIKSSDGTHWSDWHFSRDSVSVNIEPPIAHYFVGYWFVGGNCIDGDTTETDSVAGDGSDAVVTWYARDSNGNRVEYRAMRVAYK